MRLPAATRFLLLSGVLAAAIYLAWDGGSAIEAPAPPPVGEGSVATARASPSSTVVLRTGAPPSVHPHDCYYARLGAADGPPVAVLFAVAEVTDESLMNRDCGD